MTIYTVNMNRERGFYEKHVKRIMDIICALAAIIVFSWLFIIVAILVKINLGSPVIFKQPRPGMIDLKTGQEKIFYLYKFRSMNNEKDKDGNLLPDEKRLTHFGKMLRNSSMDELPEAFNILNGSMSVIGPRPQLVRDMVFMTAEQRKRHYVRPGLSGLAQTRGRNALSWEGKLETDLEYISNVTFIGDVRITINTIKQVFLKKKGIKDSEINELDLTDDFGVYLLKCGKISLREYNAGLRVAEEIIRRGV